MRVKLSNRVCSDARPAGRQYFLWDTALTNFGLRVTPKGAKSFVVQYRVGYGRNGRPRRMTIGRFGSSHWTLDAARRKAKELLGQVANGEDPLERAIVQSDQMTVNQLWEVYYSEGCEHKKPLTVKYDLSRFECHIQPELGTKKVADLKRADVERLMHSIARGETAKKTKRKSSGGKTAATRTIGLLQGMLTFAVERGIIERNVALGIKRYPDKKRERFLSGDELSRLGDSLIELRGQGVNPMGLDIIELLLLTGARRNEITSLTWDMIDLGNAMIYLSDSKTGRRAFPINSAAVELLDRQLRHSEWVFPAVRGNSHYQGLGKVWRAVRERASLNDLRLHDLRHTFASFGASSGMSLYIVGKLLGHSQPATTARYGHLSDDPVRLASLEIGHAISKHLYSERSGHNDGSLEL